MIKKIFYKYTFYKFLEKRFFYLTFIFDKIDRDFLKFYSRYKYKALSKSYLYEDLIVLFLFGLKKKKLYFEAGAGCGKNHSNIKLNKNKHYFGILKRPYNKRDIQSNPFGFFSSFGKKK